FGMQDVAQLIDQKLLDRFRCLRSGAFGMNAGGLDIVDAIEVMESGGFHEFPRLSFIPRSARVDFAMVSGARRVIEELVNQLWRGSDLADAEGRLAHGFQRKREGAHMSDFARHE